jgi:hypothetical protein
MGPGRAKPGLFYEQAKPGRTGLGRAYFFGKPGRARAGTGLQKDLHEISKKN